MAIEPLKLLGFAHPQERVNVAKRLMAIEPLKHIVHGAVPFLSGVAKRLMAIEPLKPVDPWAGGAAAHGLQRGLWRLSHGNVAMQAHPFHDTAMLQRGLWRLSHGNRINYIAEIDPDLRCKEAYGDGAIETRAVVRRAKASNGCKEAYGDGAIETSKTVPASSI